MKTLDGIDNDEAVLTGAALFRFSEDYRFWGGRGTISIGGQPYKGIDDRALIVPIDMETGGGADGVVIRLSGLDPDVAASIEDEDYHQKPCVLHRLTFNETGVILLGHAVYLRGRVDIVREVVQVNGFSTLEFHIEGPRRDMGRFGTRTLSDADQRILGGPTDGGLKHTAAAGQKTLNWMQKTTSARRGLGGVVGGIIDGVFDMQSSNG